MISELKGVGCGETLLAGILRPEKTPFQQMNHKPACLDLGPRMGKRRGDSANWGKGKR